MSDNKGSVSNPIATNLIWKGADGQYRQVRDAAVAIEDIQEKIDSGELGSGDSSTVKAPSNLSPSGTEITIAPTFTASEYSCQIESDIRQYREFQCTTASGSYDNPIFSVQVNADSYTPTEQLSLNTSYKWRCRDVSTWGATSSWASAEFTTVETAGIATPTLTVEGAPDAVIGDPTLTASAFETINLEDTHESTDWVIEKDGSEVWSSLDDTTNKLSIQVPYGTLETSTAYTFKVRFKGATGNYSEYGTVDATTKSQFVTVTTPVVTLSNGTENVLETPTINGSAFSVTSGYSDTHESTDYIIVKANDDSQVWSATGQTGSSLYSITVPSGVLQVSTQYKVKVRYKGTTYGYSSYGELDFTTADVFSYIEAPTLTVLGAPDGVPKNPTLSASTFKTVNADGVTHTMTSWQVIRTSDSVTVFESLNDTTNLTSIQCTTNLTVSTEYRFRVQYKGGDLTSEWVEVTGVTPAAFTGIATPTITTEETDLNNVTYQTIFVASDLINYEDADDYASQAQWYLYLAAAPNTSVWSTTYHIKYITCFLGYNLQPSTTYILKYRQYSSDGSTWTDYASITFTTAEDLDPPTLKFTMKNSIQLSTMFSWWSSDLFKVYVNGEYNETLTLNYASKYSLSADGDEIEIVNETSPTNYPIINLSDWTNRKDLISVDAPLPTMRTSNGGSTYVTTNFVSSTAGIFSDCTSLVSVADKLFRYNTNITSLAYTSGGYGAFTNCSALTSLGDYFFQGLGRLAYVGGTASSSAEGYSAFTGCSSLTTLGNYLFAGCNSLSQLHGIGVAGANYAGHGAFSECEKLSSIGEYPFKGCISLTTLGGIGGTGEAGSTGKYSILMDSSHSFGTVDGTNGGAGYGAFSMCTALTALPASMFQGCYKLTSLGGTGGAGGAGGYGCYAYMYSDIDVTSTTTRTCTASNGTGGTGGTGGNGYGAFTGCGLVSLPAGLFQNTAITSLGGTAGNGGTGRYGCYAGNRGFSGLSSSVTSNITCTCTASNGTGGTGGTGGNGYGAFSNCLSLKSIPSDFWKDLSDAWIGGIGGTAGNGGTGCYSMCLVSSGVTNGTYYLYGVANATNGKGGTGGDGGIGYGAFSGCTSLSDVPLTLFKNDLLTSASLMGTQGSSGSAGVSNSVNGASNNTYNTATSTSGTAGAAGSVGQAGHVFSNCSSLTIVTYIGNPNITCADYFAYNTASKGTVYVPASSTTYTTFTSASNANVNVVTY